MFPYERKFLQTIVSFIIIHRANDKIPLPEFDETRESAGSKEKEILWEIDNR